MHFNLSLDIMNGEQSIMLMIGEISTWKQRNQETRRIFIRQIRMVSMAGNIFILLITIISGKPVLYVFARRHSTSNRDLAEMYRFIIYNIENCLSNSLPHEERLVIVFDLHNFTFDCMDYEARG